jgi:hypothetical protein
MFKVGDRVRLIKHDIEKDINYTKVAGLEVGYIDVISKIEIYTKNKKLCLIRLKSLPHQGIFLSNCFEIIEKNLKVFGIVKFMDYVQKRRKNVDT